MVGQRFGSWTVLSRATSRRFKCGTVSIYWNCRCDCGTERTIEGKSLQLGRTRSCGKCSGGGHWKPIERDPCGPHKGVVAEKAVHWLNGKEGGWIQARRDAAKVANDYRETILRYCVDGGYPPCMECNDVTVAYCAETGTECQVFLTYACGWGSDKKD